MIDKDLKRLEMVCSTPGIRKELEAAMDACFERLGGMVTIVGEKESKSKELVDAVNSILHKYREKAKSTKEYLDLMLGAKTYISLDTGLYHSLSKEAQEILGRKLELETDITSLPEAFDGRGIRLIYEEEKAKIVDFLERNLEMLPTRTQGYVRHKKRERELQPSPTTLRNEFEYRTYLRTLPEEFSFEPLYIAMRFFRGQSGTKFRLHSNFYFVKAITEKYGHPKNKDLGSVLDEAAGNFLEILRENLSSKAERREFEDFKRVLKENGKTAKILLEHFERYNLKGVSDFLGEFVQPKQQKQR